MTSLPLPPFCQTSHQLTEFLRQRLLVLLYCAFQIKLQKKTPRKSFSTSKNPSFGPKTRSSKNFLWTWSQWLEGSPWTWFNWRKGLSSLSSSFGSLLLSLRLCDNLKEFFSIREFLRIARGFWCQKTVFRGRKTFSGCFFLQFNLESTIGGHTRILLVLWCRMQMTWRPPCACVLRTLLSCLLTASAMFPV